MRTFGETLRQARIDRGITLADAERDTHIRRRYLEALESEDAGVLPPSVYTRGFIRTYADYLGLNPQAMVDLYQPPTRRDPTPTLRAAVPRVAIPREIPFRPILYALGAVAGVLIVGYLWFQLQAAAAEFRQAEGIAPVRAGTATLPPRVPTPNPIAVGSPLPTATATPLPTPTSAPTASPTAVVDGILVEFRATARVYVEASVDGRAALAETFPAGGQRTLPLGRESVIMRVSNGTAVEVFLNGRRQEPSGTQGPVEFTWRR